MQQAQRRALEEQHAASPPVKASPGIAVSVPPAATPKKAAKAAAPTPEKIQEAIPSAVPIVESPEVELKPVVKEPGTEPVLGEAEALEPEAVVLLKNSQAEVEVKVPAPVTEEALTEPDVIEAEIVQEAEADVPETEPVTEVRIVNNIKVILKLISLEHLQKPFTKE